MKIDQNKIDELCREYSTHNGIEQVASRKTDDLRGALDAALAGVQTLFRRKLGRAVRGQQSKVMRSRVWASIDHSKRPVTVLPIASATVLVRKGVELDLHFVATEENIERETNLLNAAIEAFNG